MLESVMENLIAKYPSDFFPRKALTLTGRQGSFSGVGRFDLLFKDEHQTTILMELKARPAKYEDASQLAKYYDVFKQQGKKDVLMWLVATGIPQSVREFLDRIGIEYTEIHESEYKVIALRHGEITDEVSEPIDFNSSLIHRQKSEYTLQPLKSNYQKSYSIKSKITPRFRDSMESIGTTFPAAYRFLSYIENNSDEGFWLGTATNAHLYFNNSFLSYIKLGSDGILFSPYIHGQISGSTTDNHKLIFPEVFQKLTKLNDGSIPVWAHFGNDGTVTIRKQAPSEFFTKLLDEIKKVHSKI